jgi:hypothetical protein
MGRAGRMIQPDEVAGLVKLLALPSASAITGQLQHLRWPDDGLARSHYQRPTRPRTESTSRAGL